MNLATCCPTEEKLRLFSSGDLPDLEFESVFTHVQTCEPCQNRLVEVPDTQDSFSESITKVSREDLAKVRKQMEIECGPDSESISSFLDRYVHRSDLPPALSPPCTLGQYQIQKLIGRGGMGEVYEGFQLRLHRPVAVKILRNSRQDDAASHERFLNEMKIAGGLDHPNLVRAYDAWEADGYLYLVFELLDGQSLQNLVDAEQIKSVSDVYGIITGVLEGLKHLHSKGLVHHDIKPGNVMRTTDGTIKLIDFGLSGNRTSTSQSSANSNVNIWVGTKGFMAPEPLSADGSKDHLRDIYSTGVLLRYLLRSVLGSIPQSDKDWQERLYAVSDRMARSTPEDRYQSVCDALDALHATAPNLSGKGLRVIGGNRWSKWGGVIALSATLLITILLGSNVLRSNKSSGIASVNPSQATSGTSPEDIDRKIKSEVAQQVSQLAYRTPRENTPPEAPPTKPQTTNLKVALRVVNPSLFKGIEQSLIAKLSIPELVGVPAGTFTMGAVADDPFAKPREFPNRQITITKPFQIGKYEVTVGQYRAFVSNTNYETVAERNEKGGWKSGKATSWGEQSKSYNWKTPGYATSDSHPVTIIAYEDAVAYCDWLTKETGKKFRLPTEVEWEYACRAGTTGRYYFDIQARDDHSWSIYNSGDQRNPHPVGLRFANPLGIHDIAGNVREWCLDWFAEEAYKLSFDEHPLGPNTGEFRVIRGACFMDRELFMRSSQRGYLAPDMVVNNQGFRVMCEE